MPLSDRIPKHTRRFSTIRESDISGITKVITAQSATENRGQLPLWEDISEGGTGRVIWIEPIGREEILVRRDSSAASEKIILHDVEAIGSLFGGGPILIDISGLPHHVWAPLLKAASQAGVATQVLYAEPDSYKEHASPSSASYFDLSVTFEGLAPLPGFARLSGPPDEDKCLFVALLGS